MSSFGLEAARNTDHRAWCVRGKKFVFLFIYLAELTFFQDAVLTMPSIEEEEEPCRPIVGVKRSRGFTDSGRVMKKSKVDEVMERMNGDWMRNTGRQSRVDTVDSGNDD
jgi:hypothetical protein